MRLFFFPVIHQPLQLLLPSGGQSIPEVNRLHHHPMDSWEIPKDFMGHLCCNDPAGYVL